MRAQKFTRAVALVVAVSLISLTRSATAEVCGECVPEHPMFTDAWYLSAGAMWADSNVTANLSTSGVVGVGALIDFEDDLGLSKDNLVGLFDARWYFARRWKLELEYFKLDRDNEKTVQRSLDWGDLSIPVTTQTKSTFNLEDFRVSIGYSFFRTRDKEVGFGLGAHVAKLEAGLSTVNFGSDFASQTAPLPFLTLYARMALSDRWLLNIRVDRLSLDINDIDGQVFSSGFDLIYQPWRHFSFGLGYRDVDFQVKFTKSDWRGEAQIQVSGPNLFVAATF